MPDAFLQGWSVLIVEDDYFLADDLRAAFEQHGATVIGPVGRVGHALEILSRERVDGAVLDINLGGELIYPVADALRSRHIPFVFATGYDPESIPFLYLDIMRCQKPVASSEAAWLLFGMRDPC